MAQNSSKTIPAPLGDRSRRIASHPKRSALAGGVCAVALLLSSEGQADFQFDTRYHPDGRTTVVRRIKPLNFAVTRTPDGPSPANDCPGSAFEIVNPRYWEAACVGYVVPRR